ncbi:MAG: hypothetical protein KAQ68_01215 [Clostridiales bacterium]|nr:hypothetical protein [Clostridiales bacterium]
MSYTQASTGHNGLDLILDQLRFGDNVVWQIDNIKDYMQHTNLFVKKSLEETKKVIYMRFADHEKVVDDKYDVKTYEIDPHQGFEGFSFRIHQIIESEGVCAFYVFDCLSYLLDAWASDLMISNFFLVTCPYLYQLDTVAYFAIKRNYHSYKTLTTIRETTQILLDLFNINDDIYIHPLKVIERSSSTMFLPHFRKGEEMIPLTSSTDTARLFSSLPNKTIDDASGNLDYWDKLLIKALNLLQEKKTEEVEAEKQQIFDKFINLIIGKEKKILDLASKYFSLEDITTIGARLISSGYIGGKAVGMLLARKILKKDMSEQWMKTHEPHDSFYVGSDVFYSYIIQNNLWGLYADHRKKENYFDTALELKEKLENGVFPDLLKEKLVRMLEYFGQSPIIVRSSSLLEDGYGNAFAGKYDSYFCVNQGTPEERYTQLVKAICSIYASTMSEDALTYRKKRNLDDKDEQMSLLVQRVSGDYHGNYFFPVLAGVGFSHNTYAWNKKMNPSAGFLRLVFGLGTRAVERSEGDYPRLMALDYPKMQALHGSDDFMQFSQHSVDVLDTQKNEFTTIRLNKLMWEKTGVDMSLLGIYDHETNKRIKEYNIKEQEAWLLNYEKLISDTTFVTTMQNILKTLEAAYDYPVDIEFTINFSKNNDLQINLLQCRPLQTKGIIKNIEIPTNIKQENIFFKSTGNFMGGSVNRQIDRIIYISPEEYIALSESEKYEVARNIGKLTKLCNTCGDKYEVPVLLMGPGRWGTSTISMGIPVSFSEVSNVTVLCEQSFSAGGMTPELSYGSHFFQDLVEDDIFYAAIFSENKEIVFNKDFILKHENILSTLIPEAEKYVDVIKVIETQDTQILSDINSNTVICYKL